MQNGDIHFYMIMAILDAPFFAPAQQLFVFEGCAILYKENHQIFEETDRII